MRRLEDVELTRLSWLLVLPLWRHDATIGDSIEGSFGAGKRAPVPLALVTSRGCFIGDKNRNSERVRGFRPWLSYFFKGEVGRGSRQDLLLADYSLHCGQT
jgi:hypothetical protein